MGMKTCSQCYIGYFSAVQEKRKQTILGKVFL